MHVLPGAPFERGGHVWPNSELDTHLAEYPSDLDATELIWAFSEAHPKSPAPWQPATKPCGGHIMLRSA